jgi:hypothetical protein
VLSIIRKDGWESAAAVLYARKRVHRPSPRAIKGTDK